MNFDWIVVMIMAFVFEVIDAAFGQGYGTLGAPALLLLGYSPKEIIPAILLSQAMGGFIGGILHHQFKNASFLWSRKSDLTKVSVIVVSGILGVAFSSFLGVKFLSKNALSWYIGIMVTLIGVLLISGWKVFFSWAKLYIIGIVSAFNKGMSGGGYGPLVTGGQIVIGVDPKAAVGITDLAEAPICITGVFIWLLMGKALNWDLAIPLCIGAGVAPFLGAYITKIMKIRKFRKTLGIVVLILGVAALLKVLNP